MGDECLFSQTTASYNAAFGNDAAYSTTTGHSNVAIGFEAMQAASTANKSVAIGMQAMKNHTGSGDENNVYIGYQAGMNGTTSYSNTIVGGGAGENITTMNNSTLIGKAAGGTITTGSHNICLGNDSDPSSATSSNQCTLGSTNINDLRCNDTSISSLSDERDKTEIIDLPIGLGFINGLKPRKFKWATRDGNIKDGKYRAGFIAQELQSLQSSTSADYLDLVLDDNPDKLEAKEGHLFPVLVKAVQELSAEVTALKAA